MTSTEDLKNEKWSRSRVGSFCVLCLAVSTLLIVLVLSVALVGLGLPSGSSPITLKEGIERTYAGVIAPTLSLIAEILKSLSPWGIIFIIAVIVVLWGPAWIRRAILSSKWKVGGLEYDGSSLQAIFRSELNEAARVVDNANKEIREAYDSARSFALQLRERHSISPLTANLTTQIAGFIGDRCPEDFRLTLYVPDFIFSDRLYQIAEYYDKRGKQITDNRAGRTFSVRYGIIGRVWRSGVPEVEGELISEQDRKDLPAQHTAKDIERLIARRWGLDLEEALHVSRCNSYGAIRIERADKKLGILYFDSQSEHAFGSRDEMDALEDQIVRLMEGSPLTMSLLEVSSEVAPWSGRVRIYQNS